MKTRNKMALDEIAALEDVLKEIWALGDQDEMSVKHIGHGLAALATYGTWKAALDYELPDMELSEDKLERLDQLWQDAKGWLHGVSLEEMKAVFEYRPIMAYGYIYLDTHSDYYTAADNG